MDKTGQELFRERQRRIQDAIALRVPDRVPIWFQDAGYFPAKYGGLTCEQAIFDTDRMLAVSKEAFLDFAPDMYFRYPSLVPARACEAMAFRGLKLPGCDVSPLHSHQAVEGEWRVY